MRHAVAALGSDVALSAPQDAAPALHAFYGRLLGEVGLSLADPGSHNLLLTPGWMMVVRRAAAEVALGGAEPPLSVNSIGFAGFLLSRGTPGHSAALRVGAPATGAPAASDGGRPIPTGPLAVLRAVAALTAGAEGGAGGRDGGVTSTPQV
jgi:hypothetical protein